MPPNRKRPSPLAAHSAAVPYRPPTLVRHRFGHRAPGLPHATHFHLPLGVTQVDADSDAQAWAALPTGNGGWAPGSEWGTGGGWGSGSGWGSSTTTTFGGWGLGSGWGDDAGGWGSAGWGNGGSWGGDLGSWGGSGTWGNTDTDSTSSYGTAAFITGLFFRVLDIFLFVPGDIDIFFESTLPTHLTGIPRRLRRCLAGVATLKAHTRDSGSDASATDSASADAFFGLRLPAIFTSLNVGTNLHTPTAWLAFASIPEATMVLFATSGDGHRGPFVAVTAGA
ncbi:hypothetical protein B0H14DRAFT_3462840 [Mycena olivaceomarginata]|nr:hypothetical protein B0H14DRAFT_3462840 [Mycena olivaceomarginata]